MRVLIDLTDIEQWAGVHGGIQRVVYGISKYLYLNSDDADYELGFIGFSSINNAFYEADFKPIYDRVERKYSVEPADLELVAPSLKHRFRMGIRTRVPEDVRKNPYARKAFKGSIRVAKKSVRSVQSLLTQEHVPDNAFGFRQDDIVLILGKPWDDLAIQQTLSNEKAKINFKLVQVVYDLIISLYPHLHHPSLFEPYSKHMFEAVSASDLLLPISKSSDNDLKRFCDILKLECPKTEVIRLGDDVVDPAKVKKSQKPDVRIRDEFLLCVGTIEIRKNHNLLYYTYKLAEEKGIDLPQLIIIGGKGWLSNDTQYLINNDPKLKEKLIILNGIDDIGLAWLYNHCKFTVYPSMYEGWGLPVAESLAYSKLCVSSHASSMPEIAGDLVDYFSPYSAQECLDVIVKYMDQDTLEKKEEVIRQGYKPVTWAQTGAQVKEYITNAI